MEPGVLLRNKTPGGQAPLCTGPGGSGHASVRRGHARAQPWWGPSGHLTSRPTKLRAAPSRGPEGSAPESSYSKPSPSTCLFLFTLGTPLLQCPIFRAQKQPGLCQRQMNQHQQGFPRSYEIQLCLTQKVYHHVRVVCWGTTSFSLGLRTWNLSAVRLRNCMGWEAATLVFEEEANRKGPLLSITHTISLPPPTQIRRPAFTSSCPKIIRATPVYPALWSPRLLLLRSFPHQRVSSIL